MVVILHLFSYFFAVYEDCKAQHVAIVNIEDNNVQHDILVNIEDNEVPRDISLSSLWHGCCAAS